MDKITTINGILMATQNDFMEHTENMDVHITDGERRKWNGMPEIDAAGNMNLSGNMTAQDGRFQGDVALDRTLHVAGKVTLTGGGIGIGGGAIFYDNQGRQSSTIDGYWKDSNRTGVSLFDNGGSNEAKSVKFIIDTEGNFFDMALGAGLQGVQMPAIINSLDLKEGFSVSENASCRFGTVSIAEKENMMLAISGGISVSNASTFASGVTIENSLDVADEVNCHQLNVYSADYFRMYIQTGVGVFRNDGMSSFRFEGNGRDELEVRLGTSTGTAKISKLNQKSSPAGNDVLNTGENDARYGRLNAENTWTVGQHINLPLSSGPEQQDFLQASLDNMIFLQISHNEGDIVRLSNPNGELHLEAQENVRSKAPFIADGTFTATQEASFNSTVAISQTLDVAGKLTAGSGTFNGRINANSGIGIPVGPVGDTDVVRKMDLTRPVFLPEGNTMDTLGWNLFIRNGRPTTYFGQLVNLDDPVLILQNCVQQGDNFSGQMRGEFTYVLDLCAYRIDHPDGSSRNTRPEGVHCQWGRLYNANPVSATERPANRYDTCLAKADGWRDYVGGSPMVWPASTGGDGKQRCGFVAGFRNDLLNGRNREYLYSVLPSDCVRLILYSPGYVDNQGDLVNKQWHNNIYLFMQNYREEIQYIGYSNNAGWSDYALAMSNHGRDGVLNMTIHSGDAYGLKGRCVCVHEGSSIRTTGRYPISQSLFKPDNTSQTLSVTISLADFSLEVVAIPEWVTVSADGNGTLSLLLTANDTESERLGLVDLKMSNGITYSIVIYQQA